MTTTPAAASTGVFRARDGALLRTYSWPAMGTPRAHLILVHGIAEHAGRYPHVAAQVGAAGIAVHASDLRGFGGSGGDRAYVDRWSQYHDDLEDELAKVRSVAGGAPVVLYGHSMGGLIALGYVLADPPRPLPDLLVLSAPAIDAAVPMWKRRLAPVLARVAPRLAIANGFTAGALSSDPAVDAAYRTDPLAFHRTTARLGNEALREQARMTRVLGRREPLPVPTYVLHGAADPIVPESITRLLAGRLNVTRRIYEGLRHETHNEPAGPAVIADTIAWLDDHIRSMARRTSV